MAAKPFNTSAKGTRSPATFGQGKAATQLVRYEFTTGPEMRRWLRDAKSGRIKQGAAQITNGAHAVMGWRMQVHMRAALGDAMKGNPIKRRGREQGKLRRALEGWYPDTPWELYGHNTMTPGFRINWDEWLDKHVTDAKKRPYWRSVNFGFTLRARGHLFLSASGRFSGPSSMTGRGFSMTGGRDPRMPKVRNGAEFVATFEGYNFLIEGIKRGNREITSGRYGFYYEQMLHRRAEMKTVFDFFMGGGKGRPMGIHPQTGNFGFLGDPRSSNQR